MTGSPAPPVTVRRALVNTASHFASYLLTTGLAVVVAVVVIRVLGRAEYGVMAFVVAYLSFFRMPTSLGTDEIVIREACRRPEQASELVGGAMGLRLVLSVATVLAAAAIVPFVAESRRVTLLVMLYSLTLLFSFGALLLVRFTAELRSHIPNLALGAWAFVYLLARLGLVLLGAGVEELLAADVVAAAIGYWIRRHVARAYSQFQPRIRVDPALWRRLLREGWPIAVCGVLIDLHARFDQMLLFRLGGAEELAGYSAAVRLTEVWGVITSVVSVSLLPLLAKDALAARERMERTSTLAYRYLYMFICPISVALGFYSAWILTTLFGERFADAAPALSLLAAAEIALFSNSVTYNALFALGRQAEAALMAGVALAVNVVLNLSLVPSAGAKGAALASLVTYSLVPLAGLLLPGARRVAGIALRSLVRPAAAAFAVLSILLILRPGPIPGLGLVALLYPLALLALGGLTRADRELFRRAWTGA